ncbi:MAG TPA: NUDIX domain-containing protein [Roseiflexaceae bacterium]|nr:NUDIX domain-containing protein [Roseiflexaceae bacterium]
MRWIEQQLLSPLYSLALRVRRRYWSLTRPTLMGVRVLVARGDEVLLVRHRSGAEPWSLPGGGVERYERLAEAARREAYEETGVQVHVLRLLGVYDNFHSGTSNYVAVFVAEPLDQPRPPRSLEIAEARFFPADRLPPGVERGSRRRIEEWRSDGAGLSSLW